MIGNKKIEYGLINIYLNFDLAATAFGCSTTKDVSTGLCMNDDYALSLLAIKVIHAVMLAFLIPWCFLIAQLTFFHLHLCTYLFIYPVLCVTVITLTC